MTYSHTTDMDHDDGLVHSHDWSNNTPPGGKTPAEAGQSPIQHHDDGLVHSHDWAKN